MEAALKDLIHKHVTEVLAHKVAQVEQSVCEETQKYVSELEARLGNTVSKLQSRMAALESDKQEGSDARRREKHYQEILERQLGVTHSKNASGVTDLTGDDFHAEIKSWNGWKAALGQILAYNDAEVKDRLEVYFYGASPGERNKKHIVQCFNKRGILVYEFGEDDQPLLLGVAPRKEKSKIEDEIANFARECLVKDPTSGRVTTDEVVQAFRVWNTTKSEMVLKRNEVLDRLDMHLFGSKRKDRKMNALVGVGGGDDGVVTRPAGFPGWRLRCPRQITQEVS